MSPMSLGGRSRIWSRITPPDPIRGFTPPPQPVSACVTESFDQADSTIIGPDLAWIGNFGAATHNGKFVTLSGPTFITYTESFNQPDSFVVIGPDRTWAKTSFASNGPDGGVTWLNAFAVRGNPVGDGFAQCHIFLDNQQSVFNAQDVITVEATIAAKSVQGTGAGQVAYSDFYVGLGSGPFSFGAVVALFSNNGGDHVSLFDMSNSPVSTSAAVTVGDVLGLIVTPNSPGSSLATLEAQINGVTVLTQTNATGWDYAPAGVDIEVSAALPDGHGGSFDADNQDRLDNFVTSGQVDGIAEGIAWTVDPFTQDDMFVNATIGDFDSSVGGVNLDLYARVGGTSGPDDNVDNWYRGRVSVLDDGITVYVSVETWWWGTIATVAPFTFGFIGGSETISFEVTGSTDDFRVRVWINSTVVLDYDAAALTAFTGVAPADFQTEDGFGPFTGRRAGLGIGWAGAQDANSFSDWRVCPPPGI